MTIICFAVVWAYAYRIRSKYGTNTVMMHEHRCHTSARSFKRTSLGLIYCLIINSNNFSQHFRPLESTCLKLNSWCRTHTHTHITWTVETFNSISKVGSCLHFHERNRYIYRKNKNEKCSDSSTNPMPQQTDTVSVIPC